MFVFVSMLAYSAQEVVLEPFAGAVFALTPGQSAGLTGLHHAGVLAGMAGVALSCLLAGEFRAVGDAAVDGRRLRAPRRPAMAGMAAAALVGPAWPLHASVVALGAANGAFAVSAIGAMMGLASAGRESARGRARRAVGRRAGRGLRCRRAVRHRADRRHPRCCLGPPGLSYAAVFAAQAGVFLIAARLADGVFQTRERRPVRTLAAARA